MVFSLGQTVVDMMANGRMANSTELVLIFPVRKRRNAVSGLKENASLGSMVAMTKTEVKIENYLNNVKFFHINYFVLAETRVHEPIKFDSQEFSSLD